MEKIVLMRDVKNIMGYVGLIINILQKILVRKNKININANLYERMEIGVEIMVFRLKMVFVVCIKNHNDIFVILFSIFYIVLHI